MCVSIERDLRIRVSENLGESVEISATRREVRSKRVPEIVKPEVLDFGPRKSLLPRGLDAACRCGRSCPVVRLKDPLRQRRAPRQAC